MHGYSTQNLKKASVRSNFWIEMIWTVTENEENIHFYISEIEEYEESLFENYKFTTVYLNQSLNTAIETLLNAWNKEYYNMSLL